jgi:hydroxyacyl-ACP dehydratase HTD2-like protein with hotdog domain
MTPAPSGPSTAYGTAVVSSDQSSLQAQLANWKVFASQRPFRRFRFRTPSPAFMESPVRTDAAMSTGPAQLRAFAGISAAVVPPDH